MDSQWNASLGGKVRHVDLPDCCNPTQGFVLHGHLMADALLERSEKPVQICYSSNYKVWAPRKAIRVQKFVVSVNYVNFIPPIY